MRFVVFFEGLVPLKHRRRSSRILIFEARALKTPASFIKNFDFEGLVPLKHRRRSSRILIF